MKNIGLLLVSFVISVSALAQKADSTNAFDAFKKNGISVNVGTTIMFSDLNFSYERRIANLKKARLNLRASFGWTEQAWGGKSQQYTLDFSWIYGKEKHHLEFNIGATASFDRQYYLYGMRPNDPLFYFLDFYPLDFYPSGYLGYRYQKPGSKFFFRTGIGFPEQLGFGFGFAF